MGISYWNLSCAGGCFGQDWGQSERSVPGPLAWLTISWYRDFMSKSIRGIRKYVRKQRPVEPGTPVMTRLQPGQLNQLDAWIAKQDDAPSRPEAIRRLLAKALGKK